MASTASIQVVHCGTSCGRSLTERSSSRRLIIRRKWDLRREGGNSAELLLASPEPTPVELAAFADELDHIRKRLVPLDFQIFQLRLDGLSYREIAAVLERSHQTVRYRMIRVQRLIRKQYECS